MTKIHSSLTRLVYFRFTIQPFADPNAKKKYMETTYSAQVLSVARTLLGSMLFGLAITIGLHYFKNVVMGLAVQAVMAPLNLIENPLVIALVWRRRIRPEDKIFEEKTRDELTPDDEVEDEHGNVVNRNAVTTSSATATGAGTNGGTTSSTSLEEILLDTWDAGTSADLGRLMQAVNEMNVNDKTQELGWTPLMILAGLGVPGTASAIRQVRDGMGGDPTIVDAEGWNSLHWAAFHGSLEGAKALLKSSPNIVSALLATTDKEGKTPLDHAKQEGNLEVAKVLEEQLRIVSAPTTSNDLTPKSDNSRSAVAAADGLRKRK